MSKIVNLLGKRFGRLTVIEFVGTVPGKRTVWKCKCDCGNIKDVSAANLNKPKGTRSCGCLTKERGKIIIHEIRKMRMIGSGMATFNRIYHEYKGRATKHNRPFELTKEQFKEITQQPCFYCGKMHGNDHRVPNGDGNFKYNGLDRVDNSKGYTLDNVVPCCKECNLAKHILTQEEFFNIVKKIYEKHNLGGI